MTRHLTPDEVMARVPFADGALRFQLHELADAGLAVVAVGDTPLGPSVALIEALQLIDEHGCEGYTRGRCLDPYTGKSREAAFGAERWCDPCIARDALNSVDATDTPNDDYMYHEATENCMWSQVDPDWCNKHVKYRSRTSADGASSTGGSPGGRGTVTQETSADDVSPELRRLFDAQRKRMERWPFKEMEPPFPDAFPGPLVDGQPTWGAVALDVPPDGYECTGKREGGWYRPSHFYKDAWVLVRRTPQPQPANPEQVIAQYLLRAPEQGDWPDHDHASGLASGVVDALNAAGYGFIQRVENEETGT